MDQRLAGDETPQTSRRGGALVCLFGVALIAVDVGLVLLFWHTHTRMVGLLMYVPAVVGLLFVFAGINAVLHPTRQRARETSEDPPGE